MLRAVERAQCGGGREWQGGDRTLWKGSLGPQGDETVCLSILGVLRLHLLEERMIKNGGRLASCYCILIEDVCVPCVLFNKSKF